MMSSPPEVRAGDGVTLLRRTLFWLPLAAVAGQRLIGRPVEQDPVALPQEEPFAPLSLDEFGKRWQSLARKLSLLPADCDESYAAQLAGLIARLPLGRLPKLENGRGRKGVSAGPTWFLAPVVMVEFQLDAGSEIRLHNHPPQVVVTVGVEGHCTYRHFEIDGDAPDCGSGSKVPFRVTLSREGLLGPGRSTSLTRMRDGIHGFVAGRKPARLVDFTVSLSESEAFSYVQLDKLRDPESRTYDALWLGK